MSRRHEQSVNAIIQGILDWKDWDILNLRGIPAKSITGRVLSGWIAHSAYGLASERRWRSPYLPLPKQFDSYASARGKNFRKALRRKRQQLEMRGEVSIDLDAAAHDPRAALGRAASICRRSWKGSQGVGLLLQRTVGCFLQRLLEDQESCAFLAKLKVGETPVAYELDLHLDNNVWSYDCAYDRAWAHSSPGVLLTAAVIEDACRPGMSEYDFMRGDEPYKIWWTDVWREEMEYVMDAGTRRGRLARKLAFQTRWKLRQNDSLVAAKIRATGLLNKLAQQVRGTHRMRHSTRWR
jgi:CelD/BcsL family acetyltransferase involved in cellulose biosynthesis